MMRPLTMRSLTVGPLIACRAEVSWAHLGSNQEQPGYEPGALTD
jgi:hypothetical protein